MNSLIIWPMFSLVMLTCLVLLSLPFMRMMAMQTRKAHIKDFRYSDTDNVPERIRLINCNYRNLLELPVVFYVTCFSLIALGAVSDYAVNLAWAYVIVRVIHSIIHIGYNNVTHRFLAFAVSFVCLLLLIYELFKALMAAG